MGKPDDSKRGMTGRHPVYQVADRMKRVFSDLHFEFVDNGEGLEIEEADVSFPTWGEPQETYGWQNHPIKMRKGLTVLRTRILPAALADRKLKQPVRLLAFGRVYKDDEKRPMRHQIEGLVIEEGMTPRLWKGFWESFAIRMFGAGTNVELTPADNGTFSIDIVDTSSKEPWSLGYTGPASSEVMDACPSRKVSNWVFVINVDDLACRFLSVKDPTSFYINDLVFLKGFPGEEPACGDTPTYQAVDVLRKMGYQETCGDVFCTADTYKKMNMIQEAWDKNNQGYPLVEKLGDRIAMRTVLTPSIEETMASNFKHGVSDLRVFEVGHIYLPQDGKVLPKEHIAVAMGAYGPQVTIESFKREALAFLKAMGIEEVKLVPTGMAAAYKWNECLLVMDDDTYIKSNFGQISRKAAENHGIKVAAYMANFELDALIEAAKRQAR